MKLHSVASVVRRLSMRRGLAANPALVTLDLTHRCNLQCFFCYYHGYRSHSTFEREESFLPVSLLKSRVIEIVDCANYYLTGGEPFLYPDLEELLFYLRKAEKRVFVTTNGTLVTDAWAKKIVSYGLFSQMHFSLHGPEEVHDDISGQKGAFGRTAAAIKALQAYKKTYVAKSPYIFLECVINLKNVGHLEELARVAAEWKVDGLSFGSMVFTTEEILQRHKKISERAGLQEDFQMSRLVLGPPQHGLTKEQVGCLIEEINRIEGSQNFNYKVARSPGYSDGQLYRHFFDPDWIFQKRCTYPWNTLRIHPSGKIIPCLGVIVGDIRKESVDQSWNGEKFRNFRVNLYAHRLFPACFRCCKLQ